MYVVVNKFLVPGGYAALTLFPFIIVGDAAQKNDRILINHEQIHIRQQGELLIVPFFIWYLIEYLVRLLQYQNHQQAYMNISFEREAYRHEKDKYYLEGRRRWAFMKYLKKSFR
jgi:hypothetical protein